MPVTNLIGKSNSTLRLMFVAHGSTTTGTLAFSQRIAETNGTTGQVDEMQATCGLIIIL